MISLLRDPFRVVEGCQLCSAALSWPRPVHQLHSQESQVDRGHHKQPPQHLRRLICTSPHPPPSTAFKLYYDVLWIYAVIQFRHAALCRGCDLAGLPYWMKLRMIWVLKDPMRMRGPGSPAERLSRGQIDGLTGGPKMHKRQFNMILKKSLKHALIHCRICIVFPCTRATLCGTCHPAMSLRLCPEFVCV